MTPKIKMSMNLAPLKKLQKKSPKVFQKAMEKGSIHFLKWANEGSAQETRKPPIKWGVLRASASAFVGSKLTSVFPDPPVTGAEVVDGPAKSYQGDPLTMTWNWNAPYASRMHEHKGDWGEATRRDQDAGNKWLEKHLDKDKDALMDMIRIEVKKELKL